MSERRFLRGDPYERVELSSSRGEEDFFNVLERYQSVIALGLGRSHGDAAYLLDGVSVDFRSTPPWMLLDWDVGQVTASAGISLDEIARAAIPRGYFLPAMPQTRFVTLGGAIASDVYGMNHHVDGSIGRHLGSIHLLTAKGSRDLWPEDPEFLATLGGLGLTGFVTRATFGLIPIQTSYLSMRHSVTRTFSETLETLVRYSDEFRYANAWVDVTLGGASCGRGIVTGGSHMSFDQLPARFKRRPLHLPSPMRQHISVPSARNPYAPSTIRTFAAMRYARGIIGSESSIGHVLSVLNPADGPLDLRAAYAKMGTLQYQIGLSDGSEKVLEEVLHTLQQAAVLPIASSLGRLGPSSGGYLSFPQPGWSLSLDFPKSGRGLDVLASLCARLREAGARVSLTTDSELGPSTVPQMYPMLNRFRDIADDLDPGHQFDSDLSRRLHLRSAPVSDEKGRRAGGRGMTKDG